MTLRDAINKSNIEKQLSPSPITDAQLRAIGNLSAALERRGNDPETIIEDVVPGLRGDLENLTKFQASSRAII